MTREPYCEQAEWYRRAAFTLMTLLPHLSAAKVADIVTGALWDEARHLEPEQAAEDYAETSAEPQPLASDRPSI